MVFFRCEKHLFWCVVFRPAQRRNFFGCVARRIEIADNSRESFDVEAIASCAPAFCP